MKYKPAYISILFKLLILIFAPIIFKGNNKNGRHIDLRHYPWIILKTRLLQLNFLFKILRLLHLIFTMLLC
jgi:hypothetical protein